ncbi:methyltransferase [Ferrimonas marina]|uniref:Ribosomal RNA large subunit methyltransferase G n=1 Tax=Ferrimonas marina TaxID=299255 RepID=A0A1M5YIU2_9GAMM|nr:methyltransferase [Ferrimonas marina]SHI11463.1 23S rRNA (guanine1835-N2)-methyltransferase [Ferrimonas marina]
MTEFSVDGAPLQMERYPPVADDPLQAWDAADELLLQAHQLPEGPLWLFNDHFGALACGLRQRQPSQILHWYSDSYVAHQGLEQNLALNELAPVSQAHQSLETLASVAAPVGVLIKLPRSLRLLTWQLDWLNRQLPQGTPVVIAARQRDMPSTLPDLTRQLLDQVHPSRAVKKARLVYGQLSGRQSGLDPVLSWHCEPLNQTLHNYPNTYGSQKLDLGARLLLQHLPQNDGLVVDLGCGNGVLSVAMLQANPDCQVLAVDESQDALRACQDNTQAWSDRVELLWNDCLSGVEGGSADLVLCNPPFHQQQAVTDHIAWQMFRDARRVLRSGGRLRIVGNRHLGYHIKLTRLFGGCKTLASNAKFVVLEAQKR